MGVTPGMIESGFPSVNGVGIVLEILLKFIVFGRFWLEFQWKATPGELIGHGQPFKLTVSGGGGTANCGVKCAAHAPAPTEDTLEAALEALNLVSLSKVSRQGRRQWCARRLLSRWTLNHCISAELGSLSPVHL